MSDLVVPTDKIIVGDIVKYTGMKRSLADHRDVPYSMVARMGVSVPEEYNAEDEQELPIYNQGEHPACVGWTFGLIKTWHEFKECGQVHQFDGLSLYKTGGGGADGITMRAGAEATRAFGAPLQHDPAKTYKIEAYAGVNTRVHEAVKHAIYTNGVCAGAFMVPAFFMDGGGKEFDVAASASGEEIVGGHAIAVTGYTKIGPLLHNSWGTDWQDGGRAQITWAFWDKYFDELWTTVDLRDNLVAQRFLRFRRGLIA